MFSADSLCCPTAHFAVFCRGFCLCLCLWQLCSLLRRTPQCSTERSRKKKKAVCNGFVFPGNLDPLSLTPGSPIVLLVCEFRRRDNLLAWRELFANLYELESRIGFWKEYNHFERIYWVHRFDRFSSNFR